MVTTAPAAPVAAAEPGKLALLPLVALVVGSMIGGGVFNLPRDMSVAASPGAIVIGWVITGVGMLMLAFVYQALAVRKPALNAGPYAYAKAGFGDFVGFNSAWGYWISAFLGNVAFLVAIFSALSYFAPIFGSGNTLPAIIGASIALWFVHALVLRGVKGAAFINVVTTVAKLVPLLLFIVLAALAFNYDKFTFNFWGTAHPASGAEGLGGVLHQVRSTMLVTLWVFIGIEGASVYSARAARREDVGRATVIGFAGALVLYVLVSLVATGILAQKDLAGLKVPAMAGVLESIVGPWGGGAGQPRPGGLGRRRGPELDALERRDPLHLRQGRHVPALVRGRERERLAQALAVGDQRPDPAVPAAELLLPQRVRVLLPDRLGGDPAALRVLGRLRPQAGALRRDVRARRPQPQPRPRRRRRRDRLRPLADLRRRPLVPADVRDALRARHPRLRLRETGARVAALRRRRRPDRRRTGGVRPRRRLADLERHHQPARRHRRRCRGTRAQGRGLDRAALSCPVRSSPREARTCAASVSTRRSASSGP